MTIDRAGARPGRPRGAALLGLCLLAAACGGNDDSPMAESSEGAGDAETYYERLRDCGLATGDRLPASEQDIDSFDECVRACATLASCAELEEYECRGGEALTPGSPFFECGAACFGAVVDFTCGSGEQVDGSYVCDVFVDCEDGSDEADCPTFTCGDGEVIPQEYACDGFGDCTDESDEGEMCPVFVCGDGAEVVAASECNGVQDCTDRSDELGCITLVCP